MRAVSTTGYRRLCTDRRDIIAPEAAGAAHMVYGKVFPGG